LIACYPSEEADSSPLLRRLTALRAAPAAALSTVELGRSRSYPSGGTGWFTEGFDTADLRDAKALLEELNSGEETHYNVNRAPPANLGPAGGARCRLAVLKLLLFGADHFAAAHEMHAVGAAAASLLGALYPRILSRPRSADSGPVTGAGWPSDEIRTGVRRTAAGSLSVQVDSPIGVHPMRDSKGLDTAAGLVSVRVDGPVLIYERATGAE
jgi:hypothetical protein